MAVTGTPEPEGILGGVLEDLLSSRGASGAFESLAFFDRLDELEAS